MRTVIDMAQEAWEQAGEGWVHPDWFEDRAKALSIFAELVRAEALAEQLAQQEPFGYFKAEPFGWIDCAETDEGAIALYQAPPAQRTWVGLTDDERAAIGREMAKTLPNRWIDFDYARAVEAKLKEKNT